MKIINIVVLLLCIGMIYLLFFKKEKMTADANTKKLIQDHYKIDVDAIRNLSKLANDLTKNGKLRVPGGLEVDGAVNIKGLTTIKNELNIQNGNNKGVTHLNYQNKGENYIRGAHLSIDSSLNLLPRGCIIAWNGNTPPKGWALCDGANGTPDLRGRFIRMATLNLPKNGNNDWSYHKYRVPKKGGVHHEMDTSKRGSSDAYIQNHKFNEKGGSDWRELHLGEMPRHSHGGIHGHHCHGTPAHVDNTCGEAGNIAENARRTHNEGNNFGHGITPPYYVLTYIMKL